MTLMRTGSQSRASNRGTMLHGLAFRRQTRAASWGCQSRCYVDEIDLATKGSGRRCISVLCSNFRTRRTKTPSDAATLCSSQWEACQGPGPIWSAQVEQSALLYMSPSHHAKCWTQLSWSDWSGVACRYHVTVHITHVTQTTCVARGGCSVLTCCAVRAVPGRGARCAAALGRIP